MPAVELICSRDLAIWLGATTPETHGHFRELKEGGRHILVRDRVTPWPLFWPLVAGVGLPRERDDPPPSAPN